MTESSCLIGIKSDSSESGNKTDTKTYSSCSNKQSTKYMVQNKVNSKSFRTQLIGFTFICLASFCFALNSILLRLSQKQLGYSSSQITFLYSLVNFIASITFLLLTSSLSSSINSIQRKDFLWLVVRGFVGASSSYLVTIAYGLIPSGEVLSIYFVNPVLTVFICWIFLNEGISKWVVFSSFLSFLGASMVCYSGNEGSVDKTRLMGCGLAFLSAFFGAFTPISMRALVKSIHFLIPNLSYSVCSMLLASAMGGIVSFSFVFRTWYGAFVSLLPGITIFTGQLLMGLGFRYVNAGSGSVLLNVTVLFAFILQVVILNEQPSMIRVFGSFLIFSAAGLIALKSVG